MSDFIAHFVGGRVGAPSATTDQQRRDLLVHIVSTGELIAGPDGVGLGKGLALPVHPQRCICLSEVPIDLLERLVRRHGSFGIAFDRTWLRSRGGHRVWYLDAGSEAHDVMVQTKLAMMNPDYWGHDLWKVMRYLDHVTQTDDLSHYWDWEREWRVPERLEFTAEDVPFIFAPEVHHDDLWGALGADRVLIDPMWPAWRINGSSPSPAAQA